jgi:hypothetical protein
MPLRELDLFVELPLDDVFVAPAVVIGAEPLFSLPY